MSLVEHTPRSGVVWAGSVHARVRPWHRLPRCAFLIIGGGHGGDVELPPAEAVQGWLTTIQSWGYERVRTNAVAPLVASQLADLGFTLAQDLVLLSRAHRDGEDFAIPRDVRPRSPWRLRSHVSDILDLDRVAFGDEWCLDEQSLDDAINATSRSRIFLARRDDVLQGFVLVGLTGRTGYIQRLAVHPEVRRSGVATRLVARSLMWAQRRGVTDTVVNTETSNDPARGLYQAFGFSAMPYGLSVMERQL